MGFYFLIFFYQVPSINQYIKTTYLKKKKKIAVDLLWTSGTGLQDDLCSCRGDVPCVFSNLLLFGDLLLRSSEEHSTAFMALKNT